MDRVEEVLGSAALEELHQLDVFGGVALGDLVD